MRKLVEGATAPAELKLTLEQGMAIYRHAVDQTAGPEQGSDWWQDVLAELRRVLAAPSAAAAAEVIAWWHNDWAIVDDTAVKAARRIRRVATKLRTARALS
ncbi:MAG: hypothetical protein K2X80_12590 [Pseudomonadaceae bacterium]|nr:hypothetical protein [Pseudomonadaceae bacterium]